jgi:hypothetical protein
VGCQHWLWSWGLTCSLVLGSWLAPAGASASELSWSGPTDCEQREQLVFQLERALAAPLSEVAAFQFQVHVERTTPCRAASLTHTRVQRRARQQS